MRRCSGTRSSWGRSPSAGPAQELAQNLVEALRRVDADDVTGTFDDLEASVGRRLCDLTGLVDGEELVLVAHDHGQRPREAGHDLGRVTPVAERLDAAHQLVDHAVIRPWRRELAIPAFDPLGL